MIEEFVELLYAIGVSEAAMFCSSISEIGIPNKEDIYEYLFGLLESEQVIPIFMLSDNYYASVACLNEMGAVWMKKKDYYTFLLPGFSFEKIKGAINPRKRGILLDYTSEREFANLKESLNQFQEELCKHLNIEPNKHWERMRDKFIRKIQNLKKDDGDNINIDLKVCEGLCIGKHEREGCQVIFDKIKNKIHSNIDFQKTDAEICSIVIHTSELDLRSQYRNKKKLRFDLKADRKINSIDVECQLKNMDVRVPIETSTEWENYSIPLPEFNGPISEWEGLKEVKFLFKRASVLTTEIEIRNVAIK